MRGKPASPRVLHLHGSLAAANPQAERCVRLIGAFGSGMRHTLVSADGRWSALDAVSAGVTVERRSDFPPLSGAPLPGRLQRIAQAMVDYHLVLTYGWGAIDAALAHTLFSKVHALAPLIHHEDGSDETPRQRARLRSAWYRRIGLGKAAGLVVPTELMEGEALARWQQPLGRVKTIPDGIDLASLGEPCGTDTIPRLVKRPGERWIACPARAGGDEAIGALFAALREVDPRWHLVLLGDSTATAAAQAKASMLALDDRVHFVPRLVDPAVLIRLADIVAIAGSPEPLPFAALQAMGARKPVVGFETGELARSVAPDNAPFILRPGDAGGLAVALQQLAGDEFLRRRTGEANRERAEAEHDGTACAAAYRRLYASAMGRAGSEA